MVAQFEAQMNSVERIKYYVDNIPKEEPDADAAKQLMPPPEWPEKGAIEGQLVSMRYRDGPMVVKGLSFSIAGGEKVGIAGRTGSGKSSLMVALFRIQELASGKMFIDGVDCSTVPLHVLRSKLGIIPQDPVMFSATGQGVRTIFFNKMLSTRKRQLASPLQYATFTRQSFHSTKC